MSGHPPQPRPVEPAYLAGHLQELLARDDRVHEPELNVTVERRRVVITGVAPTEERRAAVDAVIAEACPEHEVVNRVTVADYDPPEGGERIA